MPNLDALTGTPLNKNTSANAASLIAKATAGTAYVILGYNAKTSAQFIQVHDSATLPSDTAVPETVISVPASSNFSIDYGAYGKAFGSGIVVCNSSTQATKTVGTTDCWFEVLYV